MNDTVILTFTYPLIEPYFEDFLSSCDNQTNKDFDVIIINDGLSSLGSIIEKYHELNIKIKDNRGTISENRLYALNLAKQSGYKYVILADSDDFFSDNRVQKTKEMLSVHEIVANDFSVVNIKGEEIENQYISKRMENGSVVDFESIIDKNIIGFSNSAFRAGILPEKMIIPQDTKVVDWYFYTILLYKGHKAAFTNEMTTYYRQYGDNMIGINNETINNYKHKLALKAKHYKYLSDVIPALKSLADKYSEVENLDDDQIQALLENNRINHPLWWENIKI